MAKQLKNSIQELLDKKYSNSWQINILKNIDSIFGNLRPKVQIEKIYEDCIILGVYDSCWMQELYMLSNIIINKINSKLDKPRIKYIKFKHIKLKNKINKLEKANNNSCKIKTIKELTIKEKKALDKIEDQQLNLALKNFLIRCYDQKEQKEII